MAKLILVLGFVVAFAAGLTLGVNLHGRNAVAAPATRPGGGRVGFLTAELRLTPEQQEQMKVIWSETARRGGREQEDRHRQFREERDEAIAALIRPEERERYEQVMKQYSERMSSLGRERRSGYEQAVEKSKQILGPEQRQKFEEILKREAAERAARGDRDQQGRRAGDRATSQPASEK